jgi:flagellum-specific ATP synthase
MSGDGSKVEAEVVGFAGDKLYLMPTGEVHGLAPAARVIPQAASGSVHVGPGLLGRVIDGNGIPLDGLVPSRPTNAPSCWARPSIRWRASHRHAARRGCAFAQCVADGGPWPTYRLVRRLRRRQVVLLGMMARYTTADVIVVGLIGERGREVKEFVERILGPKAAGARWWWPVRPTTRR